MTPMTLFLVAGRAGMGTEDVDVDVEGMGLCSSSMEKLYVVVGLLKYLFCIQSIVSWIASSGCAAVLFRGRAGALVSFRVFAATRGRF